MLMKFIVKIVIRLMEVVSDIIFICWNRFFLMNFVVVLVMCIIWINGCLSEIV